MGSVLRSVALVVAASVALVAASAAGAHRLVESEADRVTVDVVGLEAATRVPSDVQAGQARAHLVVEALGGPLLDRAVQALVLDVALEGVPLGRVSVAPEPAPDGAVRFRIDLTADFESEEMLSRIHARSAAENPGALRVQAHGSLKLALGVERPVTLEGLARVVHEPAPDGAPAAF